MSVLLLPYFPKTVDDNDCSYYTFTIVVNGKAATNNTLTNRHDFVDQEKVDQEAVLYYIFMKCVLSIDDFCAKV